VPKSPPPLDPELERAIEERLRARLEEHAAQAFVDGDAVRHRAEHEAQRRAAEDRRDLARAVRNHVAAGVVMALLMLLGVSTSEWVRAWVAR
jgi:hypothetical protein